MTRGVGASYFHVAEIMVFFWKAGTSYTEGSGLRIEFYTDCMITSQAHLMTVLKQLLKEFWLPLLAAI
ncbi:MAG TPA: hypothetical protein VMC85_07835, partial [Desulfomonilaceae bacterium]|nr:hypothetical protein [Desulfomonilaceae bacterium]